jgi:hypothetical protein
LAVPALPECECQLFAASGTVPELGTRETLAKEVVEADDATEHFLIAFYEAHAPVAEAPLSNGATQKDDESLMTRVQRNPLVEAAQNRLMALQDLEKRPFPVDEQTAYAEPLVFGSSLTQ